MSSKQSLMTAAELEFATAVSGLVYCNPFLPERVEWERRALGGKHTPQGEVWSVQPAETAPSANLAALQAEVEALVPKLHRLLADGSPHTGSELELYRDLVNYMLYYRYQARFYEVISGVSEATVGEDCKCPFFADFRADFEHYRVGGAARDAERGARVEHLFACLFQIRRAFHYIFRYIVGQSLATARLRAAIWQSVFTHDMKRYERSLYLRMGDIASLVTGPSGSGKELVARAIGYSRYIPFDGRNKAFKVSWRESFHPLNLTALSPTLVESELFGHRKGAFTGALEDHVGWLEACGPYGSVFLDEIGDVNSEIQVKLLRVLEARHFSRLGETSSRQFEGKLIAATNRDLSEAMGKGLFRKDLYYRLCSDIVQTPSLRERIEGCPAELETLVAYLARRVAGEDEADSLAGQVREWIGRYLPPDYDWPGNVRELEQVVRNILIRGSYRPHRCPQGQGGFLALAEAGRLTADELLSHYCRHVHAKAGTYEGAGRILGLDRRTVKSRIDSLADGEDQGQE
jgi:hypothetical protein